MYSYFKSCCCLNTKLLHHHHRMHVETELAECRDHQRSRVQGDRRVVRGGDSRVGGGPGATTD